MDDTSGVGVLDKSVALIDAVHDGATSLSGLVEATGIPRATAHRLAVALERHGLLTRDEDGGFVVGQRVAQWSGGDPLLAAAQAAVLGLRDTTRLSAQVYRRRGDHRECVAAAEPATGLRDGVPVGSMLTMRAGSAAQVLTAWLPAAEQARALRTSVFTAAELESCRARGWAHSTGQREPGVASISAPVRDGDDVAAAVSISGPLDRLRKPSRPQIRALLDAARTLSNSG